MTAGLTVRLVDSLTNRNQSQLLDATPGTPDVADAPLQPGEQLTDESHGIVVKAELVDGHLVADVTMPKLADDTPPTAPGRLRATTTGHVVVLNWDAATDDTAVARYDIERDGQVVGTTTSLTYTDAPVGSTASYRVVAVDPSENRAASDPTTVRVVSDDSTSSDTGDDDTSPPSVSMPFPHVRIANYFRRGRYEIVVFQASYTSVMRAYTAGQRVGVSRTGRMRVRLALRGVFGKAKVRVTSRGPGGTSVDAWKFS